MRILYPRWLAIPNITGRIPNPTGIDSGMRYFRHNQNGYTPDFLYPLLSVRDISHQQKKILSGRDGSGRGDPLRQSHQRHPGGGLLCAWHLSRASHCISPYHRGFTVSSRSVGLLIQTNTLALWRTVTIRRNGFIGYVLALVSQ